MYAVINAVFVCFNWFVYALGLAVLVGVGKLLASKITRPIIVAYFNVLWHKEPMSTVTSACVEQFMTYNSERPPSAQSRPSTMPQSQISSDIPPNAIFVMEQENPDKDDGDNPFILVTGDVYAYFTGNVAENTWPSDAKVYGLIDDILYEYPSMAKMTSARELRNLLYLVPSDKAQIIRFALWPLFGDSDNEEDTDDDDEHSL